MSAGAHTLIVNDPFHRHSVRTSKGGGTKCTPCDWRLECHDCCACVPQRVCMTLVIYGDAPCGSVTGIVPWNCQDGAAGAYETHIACGEATIDLALSYERGEDGRCYAVLESECLGLVGPYRIWQPFSSYAGCRCPNFDFDLDLSACVYGAGAALLSVRPSDEVSVGWQRCPNRGPNDCTGCRCVCRCLCLQRIDTEHPEGIASDLCWYEDDYVEVSCCCRANRLPRILSAIVDNVTGCLGVDGEVVTLEHDLEGEDNVWIGETMLYPDPIASIRVELRCRAADGAWSLRIVINGEETIVEGSDLAILSCNPFHMRAAGLSSDELCDGLGGLFNLNIEEFQGWIGPHPTEDRDVTVYLQKVPISDPVDLTDCKIRVHFQAIGQSTLKDRTDVTIPSFPCTDTKNETHPSGASFTITGDPATYSIACRDCETCATVEEQDPYFVSSNCCEPVPVPRALVVTIRESHACACAEGAQVSINFDDATERWIGDGMFCGCAVHFELECAPRIGGGGCADFRLIYNIPNCGSGLLAPVTCSCDPFELIFGGTTCNACCQTLESQITFEVTE
jgi:hypothetical protein